MKKTLTGAQAPVIIIFASFERYRSGHNGAVLKTVWVQAHVGSNPTLSAIKLNKVIILW